MINIREKILEWADANPRDLPWKKTKDPYRIWVSEIILQQTRVDQGIGYYHRFLKIFPTIFDLAQADLDLVMKTWEGLGYYRRATHMHETARHVVKAYDGIFPDSYKDILSLKGIGSYTAAAIASFAYALCHPVVDGNVARVLSRLFAMEVQIDTSVGRKRLQTLAEKLIDPNGPARFNQAIMDFGATVCTPKKTKCLICPLSKECRALEMNLVHALPKKRLPTPKKDRYFHYLKIHHDGNVFIRRRDGKDIWQNLYELVLLEGRKTMSWNQVMSRVTLKMDIISCSNCYVQTLSHQRIHAIFAEGVLSSSMDDLTDQGYIPVNQKKLRTFAFPKVIDCYLTDKSLNLDSSF